MEHPGDIIITAIITTGHRIIGRRLPGRRIGRLPDLQAGHPADRPGPHRCLQKGNIATREVPDALVDEINIGRASFIIILELWKKLQTIYIFKGVDKLMGMVAVLLVIV